MGIATVHAAIGLLLSLTGALGGNNAVLPVARGALFAMADTPLSAPDALARGLAALDDGLPAAAIPLLENAVGTPLEDLRRFSLGRALLAAGRPAEAVAQLDALRDDPTSPWRPAAARLHPAALRAAGELRRAVRSYELLLKRYAELPDEPAVRWELARTHDDLRARAAAAAAYAELDWRFPESPEAAAARERLAELRAKRVLAPSPSYGQYLSRAARYRLNRRFALAHSDLDAAERLADGNAGRRQAVFADRLATWERAMDWPALIAALEPLVGAEPEADPARGRLLSDALRRAGRVDEGLALLERLATKSRGVTAADVAAAWLQEGRIDEARACYEPLLRKARRGPPASFDAAWREYRLGDLEAAIAGFDRASQRRSGAAWQRARYWYGRALLDAGRTEAAALAFREVAARDPLDYYAILARSRLLDLGQPEAGYDLVPERLGGSNPGRRGLIAPAGAAIADAPAAASLPPETLEQIAARHGAQLPRLPRAALLLALNRPGDARRELRLLLAEIDTVARNPRNVSKLVGRPLSYFLDRRATPRGVWGEDVDDPALVRKLARADEQAERARLLSLRRLPRETLGDLREAFRAAGDPWGVRRLTFKLESWSKGLPSADNRAYYMDTNPLAWRDDVVRAAASEKIDPALVWAIMTVESAYNETAHSVANARGLLQLLPRTAWLCAGDRGEPPPHPTELLAPGPNVTLGVWYLGRLLERFQGQELLAAAAYNAGPHRIAWRIANTAHLPFDVVLEDLPRDLGREYAKKVLKFVGHFRRVYLDDPVLYVGQAARPPVAGINY